MNFVKSLFVTLLFITAPVILESCGDCGDRDEGSSRYDMAGMTMHLYDRATYQDLPTTTVTLSEISFRVDVDAQFTSMLKAIGSAAYACSPAPSIANQKISSVVITSNNDISTNVSSKSKGEDLVSLFIAVTQHSNGPVTGMVGQEFVGDRLEFFSDLRVTSPQTHAFTFTITLDNGEIFEMTTRGITLVPS
jgi:hypothetical protein